MTHKKGFTLIELLVVIGIIGVLASVVLTSLTSARQKGRDGRRIADIKQVQVALEIFFDNCGEYPDSIYANVDGCIGGLAGSEYLTTVPTDPVGGAQFAYDNITSAGANCAVADATLCTRYHLGANLEAYSTALETDADACASGCTNVGPLDGRDANTCEADDDNTKKCFDLMP